MNWDDMEEHLQLLMESVGCSAAGPTAVGPAAGKLGAVEPAAVGAAAVGADCGLLMALLMVRLIRLIRLQWLAGCGSFFLGRGMQLLLEEQQELLSLLAEMAASR
jgi:hypothetical protein